MSTILEWVKNNKKFTLIILLGMIFFPIFFCHIIFKIPSPFNLLNHEFESGDLLGYFGNILSFIGTVFLGYVAICQTERANSISNELAELEWKKRQPCLDIGGNQAYNLYIDPGAIEKCNKKYGINDFKIRPYYINKNNRTGIITTIAVMVIDIKNTGGSDIRNIFVKSNYCYLSTRLPEGYDECDVFGIEGDTYIKQGESKRLFIEFQQELDVENENFDFDEIISWVNDNKLMIPAFDFDLQLITTDEIKYNENLVCTTSIPYIDYKKNEVKRYLSSVSINVKRQK